MKIEINSLGGFRIRKKLVNNLLQTIGRVIPRISDKAISIAFVDNRTIKQLNQKYRKKNYPTDVLSFAEMDTRYSKKGGKYIGEIIIAVPYARQQAKKNKHSLARELEVLITHGFLHLIGYDHLNKKDEQKMKRKEKTILDKLLQN